MNRSLLVAKRSQLSVLVCGISGFASRRSYFFATVNPCSHGLPCCVARSRHCLRCSCPVSGGRQRVIALIAGAIISFVALLIGEGGLTESIRICLDGGGTNVPNWRRTCCGGHAKRSSSRVGDDVHWTTMKVGHVPVQRWAATIAASTLIACAAACHQYPLTLRGRVDLVDGKSGVRCEIAIHDTPTGQSNETVIGSVTVESGVAFDKDLQLKSGYRRASNLLYVSYVCGGYQPRARALE